MAGDGNERAVLYAIIGNSMVMVAKFIAFTFTGSAAMLAEGIHSIADVSNQSLTLFGIKRSKRLPDNKYKRGYGRERFVWSLISAVGIFFLGFGVTFYHGIESLFGGDHAPSLEGDAYMWSVVILIASLFIEGWVLWNAFAELKKSSKGKEFMKYIQEDADPSVVAVAMEDSAACLGILIALGSIILVKITGEHYWDALGSISISFLLGSIALWLMVRNRELLMGQSIPADKMVHLNKVLASLPQIDSVTNIHSEVIGAEVYDVQMELNLNEKMMLDRLDVNFAEEYKNIGSAEELEAFCRQYGVQAMHKVNDIIDELETQIKSEIPEILYIDIEPD